MFSKTYGYILNHPATRRGYWGIWYYKSRYEEVLKPLSKFCKNKKLIILDLGCGSGIYAQHIRKLECQCDYVGCDIDAKVLRYAHRGPNIGYVLCDIQRLPFRQRSVQVVLCSEVLEHLGYPYRTLYKICETTSGILIITFPKEHILSVFRDRHPEHISEIDEEKVINSILSRKFKLIQKSEIFRSYIPCGILEFLNIPRNQFTEKVVGLADQLLKEIVPSALVPHKTILIEAELIRSLPQ